MKTERDILMTELRGLGNDLREIELPDAVADKVGAKESGQLIDLLPWNRPDYPLKPKKGSGL